MKAWDVLKGGGRIDTVYYDDSCDAEYVRATLIDHDGYDPRITVRPGTGYSNRDQRMHAPERAKRVTGRFSR